MSVRDAVEAYSRKNTGRGAKRKNAKPEEAVVKDHVDWYESSGFFIKRYESKAKFIKGVWREAGLDQGTPDLGGTGQFGYSHWNEIKAPGRRSSASEGQLEFLERVIELGGFGCVSDSLEYTKKIYYQWLDNRSSIFLLQQLPGKSDVKESVRPADPPF